jgi:hypothetical protein
MVDRSNSMGWVHFAKAVLGQKLGKMRFPESCNKKNIKKAIVREEFLPELLLFLQK